jgi:hypothetical protein
MVDHHPVAASSHPSHCEREPERETTSRSRAGRSQRPRGRTDTTIVVLESQPTAGTTASSPAALGPNVALLVAHQLLNNPPPVEASPSAAEQCHHDVDQLVITAINMSHHEGRRQPFAQQSRFPSVARTPSVAQVPPGATRCASTDAASHADGQLPDDGPQGGDQPSSRWGGQSHHHRPQPREPSRLRGSQPRERL